MKEKTAFLSPIDGDMLNEYDGRVSEGSLITNVKVLGIAGRKIKINGIEAKHKDGVYSADIQLKDYKNTIEAVDIISGEKLSIIVFWLKNFKDKYRLSIDDNIWFLKDISNNADIYKSIFDNQYLGALKKVHDTFGTKIHLNLFYQTEGFNLSMMTDKYKNEWKENSGWLRLSFHSLQEEPDRPYIKAGYDEVKRDCKLVVDQIKRFAGEELLGPVMSLHWGDVPVEGCRALRDSGYTALAGYFNVNDPDPFAYYLNKAQRTHVNKRFIWRDNNEGIIFARMALVINLLKLDQIIPYLDNLKIDSHKPAYVDFMIHEQYFHPTYAAYQPDYMEKITASVRWASEKGYQPAFLSECIFD
jgi:hypothetical protein